MRLFIANCTQQEQIFNYRVLESPRPFSQTIGLGRQIQLADPNLNIKQIQKVIEDNRKYGLLPVEELDGYRGAGVITYICSLDKPVPGELIAKVVSHNRGELRLWGEETRKQAALAVAQQLGEMNETAGATMQVTIEEEKSGTMEDRTDSPLSVGYKVGDGQPAAAPGTRKLGEAEKGRRGRRG